MIESLLTRPLLTTGQYQVECSLDAGRIADEPMLMAMSQQFIGYLNSLATDTYQPSLQPVGGDWIILTTHRVIVRPDLSCPAVQISSSRDWGLPTGTTGEQVLRRLAA